MKLSEFLTYFTDTIFRRDVNEWRNPAERTMVPCSSRPRAV